MASVIALGACVHGRPSVEYVLAQQAFLAAKEVDAAKYSPSFYHKAEESYRRGVNLFNDRQYDEAIEEFQQAKSFAERAENAARAQRQKTGDEAL